MQFKAYIKVVPSWC